MLHKTSAYIKKNLIANLSTTIFFWKTKIKSYDDETSEFQDKEIFMVGSNHTCLAVISFDSDLKKDENYYPQMFLKECKHIEKEKKLVGHITEDIESILVNSDEE